MKPILFCVLPLALALLTPALTHAGSQASPRPHAEGEGAKVKDHAAHTTKAPRKAKAKPKAKAKAKAKPTKSHKTTKAKPAKKPSAHSPSG